MTDLLTTVFMIFGIGAFGGWLAIPIYMLLNETKKPNKLKRFRN